MSKVISSVRQGLAGILSFKGRSSRTDFWFYAIFVLLVACGIWGLVMSLEMGRTFEEVRQFASANPDKVTIVSDTTSYSVTMNGKAPGVGPDFGYLLKWLASIALIAFMLLASAAVKRLHDSDRSGFWIVLPLPFLFGGLWLMNFVFGEFSSKVEPNMSLFAVGLINNMAYLVTLGFVGFLLLRSGSSGKNRFGSRAVEENL